MNRKGGLMVLQRIFRSVVLIVAVVGLFSGCANEPKVLSGIITQPAHLKPGEDISAFTVTLTDGEQTTFAQLKEPIAIVAFVQTHKDQCCWISPELMSLAYDNRLKPITVAQISLPKGQCGHGPGCMAACHLADPHLVSLCDMQGIALKAFKKPEPDSVYLINRFDKVDMIGDLSDLDSIAQRAKKLADDVEEQQKRIYEN